MKNDKGITYLNEKTILKSVYHCSMILLGICFLELI